MIRGTTHFVAFDCFDIIDDAKNVQEIEITFNQEDNYATPIYKYYSNNECDFDMDTKIITIELTPQETLLFTETRRLKVQLRIRMLNTDGDSYILGNFIQSITVYPTLSEDLLEDGENDV